MKKLIRKSRVLKMTVPGIIVPALFFLWIQTYSQPMNHNKCTPLRTVLAEIGQQSGIRFIYRDDLIDAAAEISGINNSSLENILRKMAENKIAYKIYGDNSFVLYREQKQSVEKFRAVVVRQDILDFDKIHSVRAPQSITKTDAPYPAEALKQRIEGNVGIKVFVDKKGNVTKSLVEQSSGFKILDSAAVEYAKKMKFIPALADGMPQNIWLSMVFRYEGINEEK